MFQRFTPDLRQKIPDYYCEKHLEPRLFCDDDQIALCVKCTPIEEHKHHMVYGLEETAENYRNLLEEILNMLRKKLETARSMFAEEQERMVMVQEEEQNFKAMIESEYRMRFRLLNEENLLRRQGCLLNFQMKDANVNQLSRIATELEEKSIEAVQRLNNLARQNMRKLKESEGWLFEQICSLQALTAELEKKCEQPTLALLQNARSSLERSESLLIQCLEPVRITELSLSQIITGMSKTLRVLQRYITLDPETAHPCLVVSEDLRSVRFGNGHQNVPGNPWNFDFSATVLGMESFTSGRHYWVVDVENATNWQLGIYMNSASRRSDIPNTCGDKILLTRSMMGTDSTLWIFPHLKRVFCREQIRKVGIFLDYEYGELAFYNVTQRALIYSLSCLTFHGTIRPIFSFCITNEGMNSDSVTICPPPASYKAIYC
ncbi:PREDICTED: probable E3 ubiquitin-protein ligase TRIML2 [Chrysochloris asiatica]|uniref:Probable E3 ubiquitin-protein ligase TRIML2 n=1 Tax=Chrysochloris asiatica TaxID=185453 RepID=A0A9B0WGZ6_CHRAS|nr:PREDICTED: probable E3 ubiquitin-protein ligase TRIML2 [Chrysochloris asiatica]